MYISIDVGGTNIRVAGASDLSEPIFSKAPLRRKSTHDFEDDMAFIVQDAYDIAGKEPIEAVGISAPGMANEDKTAIQSAQNLASWNSKPLVASLQEGLHALVFYDSDEPVAALGEAYYGSTAGDFDYLIWGTGIGGARVEWGDQPRATQLNWQSYFAKWEDDNGGAKLMEKFRKSPETFTDTEWEIVTESFKRHLRNHIATHRPKTIVFGGGLAVKHALMIKTLGRDLGTQINVTQFGEDSGLMGGFGLIRHLIEG